MKKKRITLFHLLLVLMPVLIMLSFYMIDGVTSSSGYCLSCHEMQSSVGQGWKASKHYDNSLGIVAKCTDCHVTEGVEGYFTTKLLPGLRDHVVHFFGQSNPEKMDWVRLRANSRKSVSDSSCRKCHSALSSLSMSKAGVVAHARVEGEKAKRCLACHVNQMHPQQPAWNALAQIERVYSRLEIAGHSTIDNFYIILDNIVYDVTELRKFHSGGSWSFSAGVDNTRTCRKCHKPEDNIVPLLRLGKVVDVKTRHSPYYVGKITAKQPKAIDNNLEIIDDLGISARPDLVKKGAQQSQSVEESSK